MKQITITIHDGITPYRITPSDYILGRRYENAVTEITVIRPISESSRTCVCVVEANGETIDNILMTNNKFVVTSNLSQYTNVTIGFVFFDTSGYTQTTESLVFQFAPALRPLDFAPLTPEAARIVFDLQHASVARLEYDENAKDITGFNSTGEERTRIHLPLATEADSADIRAKMITNIKINGVEAVAESGAVNININIIDGGQINE
ncbi:MAG: hypothetical protein LBP79_01310 [Clostridiales bacterium]|jgi:hypothetical protein|nr:hypothetical protein [Clostridiales bacterium]